MTGPEPTNPTRPTIGVFDSGFGGLTVLRALMRRLPHARFAFLGDTARLPYGSKSRRTIARYAAQSARFLVREQGAEFLVIACNTASALALDAIQEAVPAVPVLGVIEPGASAAGAVSQTRDVLVIATDATVQSHAYAVACRALGLRALEKACPLLVPLVEEGWTEDWTEGWAEGSSNGSLSPPFPPASASSTPPKPPPKPPFASSTAAQRPSTRRRTPLQPPRKPQSAASPPTPSKSSSASARASSAAPSAPSN
jgi:hypothetical protein